MERTLGIDTDPSVVQSVEHDILDDLDDINPRCGRYHNCEMQRLRLGGLEGNVLAERVWQANERHTGILSSIDTAAEDAAQEAMRQRDRQIGLAVEASAELVRIRENTSDAFLAAAERLIGGSQLSGTYTAQIESLRLATDQGIVANPQLAGQYEASFRAAAQILAQEFLGFPLVDAPDVGLPGATPIEPTQSQSLHLTVVIPATPRVDVVEIVEDVVFDALNDRRVRVDA